MLVHGESLDLMISTAFLLYQSPISVASVEAFKRKGPIYPAKGMVDQLEGRSILASRNPSHHQSSRPERIWQ